MPFATNNGFNFTEQGIAAYAPTGSGVYGIYSATEWIYVGESKNLETRLYEHLCGLSDQSARIWLRNPTAFVCELVAGEVARQFRERVLIAELNPYCNR